MKINGDYYLQLLNITKKIIEKNHGGTTSKNETGQIINKIEDPLFKIWSRFDLPFNEKNIIQLINYLKKGNQIDITAKIEAFAFFIKNNYPLLNEIIDGLSLNLSRDYTLSEELTKIIKLLNNKPGLLLNKLSLLQVNMDQTPEKLTQELQNYPDKLIQAIKTLRLVSNKNTSELLNYLLGQQLINKKNNNSSNTLYLEIPLFLPQYNKTISGYLQIMHKGNRQKNKMKDYKKYKISFIISLEKRGTIRADISYSKKGIKALFKSNSNKTLDLIEKMIPDLETRLEEMGFVVYDTTVEPLHIRQEKLQPFILSDGIKEYFHIDLRI